MKRILLIGFSFLSSAMSVAQSSENLKRAIPDAHNADILQLHDRVYSVGSSVKEKNKPSKGALCILGLDASSVVSSEDFELELVKGNEELWSAFHAEDNIDKVGSYYLRLVNKSDGFIYVDLANTLMIDERAEHTSSFFEGASMIAGRSSTTHVGVGLGIGVGVSNSQTDMGSKVQQRIISIAPHSKRIVQRYTERRGQAGSRKFHELKECGENLYTVTQKGLVKLGEVKTFGYANSPIQRRYIVTYSKSDTFEHPVYLEAKVYVKEALGNERVQHAGYVFYDRYMATVKELHKYLIGVDDNTIIGVLACREE